MMFQFWQLDMTNSCCYYHEKFAMSRFSPCHDVPQWGDPIHNNLFIFLFRLKLESYHYLKSLFRTRISDGKTTKKLVSCLNVLVGTQFLMKTFWMCLKCIENNFDIEIRENKVLSVCHVWHESLLKLSWTLFIHYKLLK